MRDIINWMIRHSLFGNAARDDRVQMLWNVVRTHVLAGQHDPLIMFEVCTVQPPEPASVTCAWEPASARGRRNLQDNDMLSCNLLWQSSRSSIEVPPGYWRRSGPWFRKRRPGEVSGGYAGFNYSDCRQAIDETVSASEILVKGL